MRIDGLQRMLDFLDELEKRKIVYFLTRYSPDGLYVTFTLFRHRVEVEFTPDEMRYSVFAGSEDVLTDEKALWKLIKEFGE